MKKTNLFLLGGALLFSVACTNTTTEGTSNTTAETTTDATAGNATSPGAAVTGASSVDGTTTNGANGTTGTTAADVTTVTDLNDAAFMMNAASSNLLEIAAGRMATQNAANADVKQYGQMMVDHHTAANKELMALASRLGTEVPTTMMPLHQEMLNKLNGKTGTAFDEDFMDLMESSHKMTIAMFEAKSRNAQNAEVKAMATKMLPILRTHLESATRIEDTVD